MLRRLFALLLAFVVVLIVVGFLLPTTVTVERSRVIEQPPEVLFEVLTDMRHFVQWAPWTSGDADVDYRLEGPSSGEGATLVWNEESEDGGGRLWIVSADAPDRVDLELELGGSEAESWFTIEPGDSGQRVSWGMQMRFGALDLVGRYAGLLLPGLVGSEYRKGLEQLDAYLDEAPGGIPDLPAERVDAGAR